MAGVEVLQGVDALERALARGQKGLLRLAAGTYRLNSLPPRDVRIEGCDGAVLRLDRRLVIGHGLVLQNTALELEGGPLEVAGGRLSLIDVTVLTQSSALLVHSGGHAGVGGGRMRGRAGPLAEVAFLEVWGKKSTASVDRCDLAGHLGAFVHEQGELRFSRGRISALAGPGLRVHGGKAELAHATIEGAREAGVYARDGAEVSLRACTISGSAFAQIEARNAFVRIVGGVIERGEDDGLDAHEGARVELESLLLRDNDIGVRAIASDVRLLSVDVVGRGAAIVAEQRAVVDLSGGELVADDAACLEAFDDGVIRAQGPICRNRGDDPIASYDGGRIEMLPPKPPAPMLDEDACWGLIADATIDARALGAKDVEMAMVARLVVRLAETSIPTIVDFYTFFWQRMAEAYRRDLWGVAYVMNGGCSDDGFDYFCGWLIGQGRERFTAAMMYPELAAAGYGPEECFANEDMLAVAVDAYKRLTGSKSAQDFYEVYAPRVPRKLVGEDWDEGTIFDRYPSLARFR
jgi:hypothetical protein